MFPGQKPRPPLSDRQFRWLTVIVSIPILVVSTKILVERTFFGAKQRADAPSSLKFSEIPRVSSSSSSSSST
ncbi:hypothetical protein BC828DRAFT_390237 [Blastocladiella britannica]|nr:hypothetical protein BC828DRAFT_390237 [Blastocladiella britannica]